ncbi:MAG: hypothetical protein L0Z73_17005 [Gammaproteobacteria bacterium]|nr:hypothetical protein [Gammaproteobacteria bacterium]
MHALKRHAAENLDQAEARTLMPGVAGAISRVGNLGLVLLIISGAGMGWMLGGNLLSSMFIIKMLLVALIVLFVIAMNYLAVFARAGNAAAAQLMAKLGYVGPVLGMLTIVTAVAAFH